MATPLADAVSPTDLAWAVSPDLGERVLLRLDVGIDALPGIAGFRESLFPTLLILGDGSVLRPSAVQTARSLVPTDRPLVPQFEIAKIGQAAVDTIAQRARDAGLLASLDYDNPGDTDGGYTRLSLSLANGATVPQNAYDLAFFAETPNRRSLADFVAFLSGVGSTGSERYQPSSYRISASRAEPVGTSTTGVASWPLDELSPGDCIDATPEQIARLPADAKLGTRFQLQGTIYALAVAPVFPDGSSMC